MTQISDDTLSPEPSILEEIRFPNVRPSPMRAVDGIPTFIVPAENLLEVIGFLKNEANFKLFEDITALDWLPKEPRFQVVYHFLALTDYKQIRLKVEISGQNPHLPSITSLFLGANWYEREIFDLFGIVFDNHPDLRRIEMPTDWVGHPLRKDYPITGPRRPNLPANQFRSEGRNSTNS